MMGCDIPPSVQFRQTAKTKLIHRVGSHWIQLKPETFVVFLEVLKIGVSVVKGAIGRELGLDKDSERNAHPSADDLG